MGEGRKGRGCNRRPHGNYKGDVACRVPQPAGNILARPWEGCSNGMRDPSVFKRRVVRYSAALRVDFGISAIAFVGRYGVSRYPSTLLRTTYFSLLSFISMDSKFFESSKPNLHHQSVHAKALPIAHPRWFLINRRPNLHNQINSVLQLSFECVNQQGESNV